MTPEEFKAAREALDLSASQLGAILNTDQRTIRKWEATGGNSARPPNPIACRVLEWLAEGFRPPQWPAKK